jgi:[glutamine synthetase] adenylyltransferase / [glutamine synthetase]-adenylyl-L-tyrosine phosphorylase
MTDGRSLLDRLAPVPVPGNDISLASLVDRVKAANGDALLTILERHDPARRLVTSIAERAPFLSGLIAGDPDFAAECFNEVPETLLDRLCRSLRAAGLAIEDGEDMSTVLRLRRRELALLVALADLGGVWDNETVMTALTRFADAAVAATVDHLLLAAHRAGRLALADPAMPGKGSGYIVLAMGKQGAGELNYSSDIDLIVLFDPKSAPLIRNDEPAVFFVRLTKRLAGLLQDVTDKGYALRVDLRLRPDPRATQVAISVEAAATYYENMGQNWERAAMIKARPCAGDLDRGEAFLDRLKPYIWRKHLDFAAIADVQSMKRQIHAAKGHATIAVEGHNLKLGRGGIREIEFFVQTQQLIAGGRNPALRGRRTLDMLAELASEGWITDAAASELRQAYLFLRRIEHRLQMIDDEQTQDLPDNPAAFARLARLSGYADPGEFAAALRTTFETVQRHYAALFEEADALAAESGSLVFTGAGDDPETIATLARMGFRQPSELSATVRGWHFGRYPATRSARARELLTELMPALLAALAETGDPDLAFISFDRFLAGLPAGVQLFSLLRANPQLLGLIATILGSAPRLALELAHRPKVLDAVLDPGFFARMPPKEEIEAQVAAAVPRKAPLEEVMDRVRVIGKEQMFRVGVRVLSDTVGAAEAGAAFSGIAEILIDTLLAGCERELALKHGRVPMGRTAVLALGKLGGREMTASSDLDLILIYDHQPGAEGSDGARPLSVGQYYARLTQRLIAAISAMTGEGRLYDVDLRLRPSGNKGPVATHLDSFRSYHRESAWTWERLALTRARVVAGDPDLVAEVFQAVRDALRFRRDGETARADILDMRRRLLAEFGGRGLWDLKHARGGLVEIEFIVQALQILHAADNPAVLDQNTLGALSRLSAAGLLAPADHETLRQAGQLYNRLTQLLRLCVADRFDPAQAPEGLRRLVAQAAVAPDFNSAEATVMEAQERVARIFDRLIGEL